MDDEGMSLINQMLKELEQQKAGKSSGSMLPKEVRAVEDPGKPQYVRLAAAVLAVMLLAGGAYFLAARWKSEAPQPLARISGKPVLSPAPAESPVPLRAEPRPAPIKLALAPQLSSAPEASISHPAKEKPGENSEAPKKDTSHPKRDDKIPVKEKLVKQVSPAQQSEYHYQRAVEFLRQGRLSEAEADLSKSLSLEPRNITARQVWVGLLLEQKRYVEAERTLQQGLQLDPGQLNFSMTLSRLQVETGDNQSALETLKRALPYAGNNPDFYGFLAALLQRSGQNSEAAKYFGMALKQVPGAGNWWIGLGISLKAENRMQEAEAAFKHAKSIENLSPELHAYADQQIGDISQAHKP